MRDIRWKQRFENFEKAYLLLKEALSNNNLSDLEKEGSIQRFEYTFELAWKTMKDYLEANGIITKLPSEALKEAFNYDIINNGLIWSDMLEDRNAMSHEYTEKKFNKIFDNISNKYIDELTNLYNYFKEKL